MATLRTRPVCLNVDAKVCLRWSNGGTRVYNLAFGRYRTRSCPQETLILMFNVRVQLSRVHLPFTCN